MKMICPHCGVKGSADDSLLGTKVKCPKCYGIFEVGDDLISPSAGESMGLDQAPKSYNDNHAIPTDKEVDDVFNELLGMSGSDTSGHIDGEDEIDRILMGDEDTPLQDSAVTSLSEDEEDSEASDWVEEVDETLTIIEDFPDEVIEKEEDDTEVEEESEIALEEAHQLKDNALEDLKLDEDIFGSEAAETTLDDLEQEPSEEREVTDSVEPILEFDDEVLDKLEEEVEENIEDDEGEPEEEQESDILVAESLDFGEEEATEEIEIEATSEEIETEDVVEEIEIEGETEEVAVKIQIDGEEDSAEMEADEQVGEEVAEDEINTIQKCAACNEYVDPKHKYEHANNVYCSVCVPPGAAPHNELETEIEPTADAESVLADEIAAVMDKFDAVEDTDAAVVPENSDIFADDTDDPAEASDAVDADATDDQGEESEKVVSDDTDDAGEDSDVVDADATDDTGEESEKADVEATDDTEEESERADVEATDDTEEESEKVDVETTDDLSEDSEKIDADDTLDEKEYAQTLEAEGQDDAEEESEETDSEELVEEEMAAAALKAEALESEPVVVGRFTVSTLIKDAFRYSKGVKGSILAGFIVMYLILIGIGLVDVFILPKILEQSDGMTTFLAESGFQVVLSFVSLILTAGIIMIAVRKVGQQPFSWKMVFGGFKKFGSLLLLFVLLSIMLMIGFLLFILPGIYLSVGYILAIPLMFMKGLSPYKAMETSRIAVHGRWWTVFFALVFMTILTVISAVPLGIGLIWTIPMYFTLIAVLYYHFFGADD